MSSPAARTMHSYELPIGLWHLHLLWMQEHHLVGEGRLFHNEILYLQTPKQQFVRFQVEEIFQAAFVLMSIPCVALYIAGLLLLIKG